MLKYSGEGDIYFFRSERVAKKLHLSVFELEAFLRRERSEHGSNGEKTYISPSRPLNLNKGLVRQIVI